MENSANNGKIVAFLLKVLKKPALYTQKVNQ